MSLGVNLLFNLVHQTASILKDIDYDVEIAETHHKHKVDAPSGTAISIGEYVADSRKVAFSKAKVLDRTKKSTKRKAAQLKIDLKTYKCTKIEHSFEIWLAESKLAWDQLRYEIRTKRQMKKQRRSA